MLKQMIKTLVPDTVICKIKIGAELFYYAGLIKKLERERRPVDFLLGTPIHINLGDHLITLSEFQFFKDIHYPREIVEIPTEVYQLYKTRIKNITDQSTTIFINGGGWMGNLWPVEEGILQDMLSMFRDNRIIIFPQTIYYDSRLPRYKELMDASREAFHNCKDVSLCVRDRASYELAKDNLQVKKLFLMADIALYYRAHPNKNMERSKILGICLRKDRENIRNRENETEIRKVFQELGYKDKNISTLFKVRIPSVLRRRVVEKHIEQVSKCSLILTDRLHGMIYAYITRTPCLIMNNKTGKVFGVYQEWLSDVDWIYPVRGKVNREEIREFIVKMQTSLHHEPSNKICFHQLREIVLPWKK